MCDGRMDGHTLICRDAITPLKTDQATEDRWTVTSLICPVHMDENAKKELETFMVCRIADAF